MTKAFLAAWIFILITPSVYASLNEIGFTVNYRSSKIDEHNFQDSTSYTGSYSYYFGAMSAVELSYTKGLSRLSVKASESEPQVVYKTEFEMIGLDFVLTLAGREAALQPYIKVGGAHVKKLIQVEAGDGGSQGTVDAGEQSGMVPSAGLGVKILLNKNFSIKAGLDAWTSPMNNNDDDKDLTIDYAARAGLSMVF